MDEKEKVTKLFKEHLSHEVQLYYEGYYMTSEDLNEALEELFETFEIKDKKEIPLSKFK